MKWFLSKEERNIIKANKKIHKENILELVANLKSVSDNFNQKMEVINGLQTSIVTKGAFLDSLKETNDKLLNLEQSINEKMYQKVSLMIADLFNKFETSITDTSAKMIHLSETVNRKFLTIEDKLISVETLDQKTENLTAMISRFNTTLDELIDSNAYSLNQHKTNSERQVAFQSELANFHTELEKFRQYEASYREIANNLINERINSEQLLKLTAESASKHILTVFNEEINQLKLKKQKTISESLLELFSTKKTNMEIINDRVPTVLDQNARFHQSYKVLKNCVLANVIPMVVGPAGSGKSHAIEQIASDLGLNFYMANRIQNTFELVGFVNAAGEYVTTQFYEAFTRGGLFFFDEVDASSPEALVTINAAIAQGYMAFPGHPTSINMHPDFKVVVAGNTYGKGPTFQHTGRNSLDAATLDRFMIINWKYDESLEENLVLDKDLLKICWALRQASNTLASSDNSRNFGKDIIISTRGIIALERIIGQEAKVKTMEIGELFRNKFFATTKKEDMHLIYGSLDMTKLTSNKYLKVIEGLCKL